MKMNHTVGLSQVHLAFAFESSSVVVQRTLKTDNLTFALSVGQCQAVIGWFSVK